MFWTPFYRSVLFAKSQVSVLLVFRGEAAQMDHPTGQGRGGDVEWDGRGMVWYGWNVMMWGGARKTLGWQGWQALYTVVYCRKMSQCQLIARAGQGGQETRAGQSRELGTTGRVVAIGRVGSVGNWQARIRSTESQTAGTSLRK